jgi:16S rRNA (guanine527-N7)-methyltransferase
MKPGLGWHKEWHKEWQLREDVQRALAEAGVSISPDRWDRLGEYGRLLAGWNRRVALTGVSDEEGFWKLVGESLIPLARITVADNYLDVGTSGGFPAIPLLICRGFVSATLLEPSARRAFALEQILKDLALTGSVKVYSQDLETFAQSYSGAGMDLITLKGIKFREKNCKLLLKTLASSGKIIYYKQFVESREEKLFRKLRLEVKTIDHPGGAIRGYILIKRE